MTRTLVRMASLACLCACPVTQHPTDEREVLVRVEGEPLYLDEFEASYRESTGDGSLTPPVGEREAAKQYLLDRLIDERLLLREAKRRRIEIGDDEIAAEVAALSHGYEEVAFSELLVERRTTPARFREIVRRRLLMERVLDEEVYARVAVTDEEVAAYYEAHRAEFDVPERVRALHIVVKTEELAQQIQTDLRTRRGVEFQDLAREFSLSPEAQDGGDLGWFPRGVMPPIFDEICFELRVGKASEVVASEYGYHIFQVTDREKGRERELAEVAVEIRFKLRSEAKRAAEETWMESLRRSSHIERHDALLANVR